MVTAISEIDSFNLLKVKIGEQEAKVLVEYVESKIESQTNKKVEELEKSLASKQDLVEVKSEILKWMFAQAFVIITIIVALLKVL